MGLISIFDEIREWEAPLISGRLSFSVVKPWLSRGLSVVYPWFSRAFSSVFFIVSESRDQKRKARGELPQCHSCHNATVATLSQCGMEDVRPPLWRRGPPLWRRRPQLWHRRPRKEKRWTNFFNESLSLILLPQAEVETQWH